MATFLQRLKMGFSAGYKAFSDPESQVRDLTREERIDLYATAWMYYRSKMFSRREGYDWTYYLAARELYKHTRLIYNPVPQIVDFYVDNIWQPAQREDFESLVTPVSDKTDEKIVTAVAQLDQWTSFLSSGQKAKRYASATGNVLIEGVDDLTRQKVLDKIVWPGYVADVELNSTGDVLSYVLEYDVYDRDSQTTYQFRKEVTKEATSYFRDDRPWAPPGATGEVEPNAYGFVFAVWIRHTDDGADYGLPACKDFNKVDEANSVASHLHDNIHKLVESPVMIGAADEIVPIVGAVRNPQTQVITPQDPRLNWVVLKANSKNGAVTVHDLASKLKLAEAHPYLKDTLTSFTDDYPELQAAAIIQKNSQLSGAALERMLGPAQNRLDGVQPGYNQQLIKLRQMQIAVAGFRANGGGWSQLTKQQQAFKPFGLRSYEQGQLDFSLERAVLVRETEMENEELLGKKAERATVMGSIVDRKEQLKIAGYTDEKVDELMLVEPTPVPTVIPNTLPENRQLEAVN